MAYATQSDIVLLYGANALVVADHDRDGVPDTDAVTRAIEAAGGEVDTYIGTRYRLPLHEVPTFLRQLTVDIALYRLALAADVATTEHRTRYEDALGHLKLIGAGKAGLVFTTPPPVIDPEATPDPYAGPQPIVQGGPEKLFTRDKMRDL
jgi:phage gp36-like protein